MVPRSKPGRGCGTRCCRGASCGLWCCAVRASPAPNSGAKAPPALEAFFTTDLTLSAEEIVREYGHRWAVEITIRDSNAFAGLGQDQCRKRQRIVGANTLRLVLAAARCGSLPTWIVARVCRWAATGPGTDRKWPPVNSTWRKPVGRPSMRPAFFPYHGSPQSLPKMTRSPHM